MRIPFIYSIACLNILRQIATANPLYNPRETGLLERSPLNGLMPTGQAIDGGPWPPDEIDWPFPRNGSIWTVASSPPHQDATEDNKLHARKEISRAFIDKSCAASMRNKILEAWEEARVLVNAQTKIRNGYRYDIPHTQWLGKDWNSWGWFTPDYSARNKANFGRLRATFSKNAPRNDYIYFECHDPKKKCQSGEDELTAYGYRSMGLWWTNHYVNFCGPWEQLPTLNELIEGVKNDPSEQKVMENFENTRTGTLFHEVWHMKDLVSNPQTLDYAYGSQNAWDLAKNKGSWWASENADSYHLDAVAIYVQQYFTNSMSPVPRKELQNLDPKTFKEVKESEKQKYSSLVLPSINEEPIDHPKIADKQHWDEITFNLWPETENPDNNDPKNTKTLAIATDYLTGLRPGDWKAGKLHWLFLEADYGKGVQCRTDTVYDEWMARDFAEEPKLYYPKGNKKIKLFGEDCEYMNDGATAGNLVCRDQKIQCYENDKEVYNCGDNTSRQTVFNCSW